MKHPPRIVVQLIHIQGGLKGQIQEFGDPLITIGRLPSSTLHFPPDEPGVSRDHARIQREGNQFKLIAGNDRFGTFVNGKQVREAVLRNGDVIEFGSGGPKVSFNAEVVEGLAEPEPMPVREPEPAPVIAMAPVAPEARPEPPRPSIVPSVPPPAREEAAAPVATPQKVNAPLIIQFGPTIRSYRELPVVIGTHARCDFVLQHAGICEQHVQLFFSQGNYWLKELTGQRVVTVNGRPIDMPVRLNQLDEIACSPQGPVFKFLGDGRLAEVETAPIEQCQQRTADVQIETGDEAAGKAAPGFLSRFVKGLR